jgi:NADH-quinone oxidoreductase subunit N
MIGYNFLFPEIFLFIASCFGLFLKRNEIFTVISIVIALFILIFQYSTDSINIFNNLVYISPFSQSIKIAILVLSIIFFIQLISIKQNYDKQVAILILFSIIGMMLTVSSKSLLSLYLAIELQSLPMYALASIDKKSIKSSEAGVKYFILGALASALMIYGISLIFFVSGTFDFSHLFVSLHKVKIIGLIFFISGLFFKLAIVPFHSWLPDVYEGSPTIITTFFAAVSKISIVAVFVTIFSGYLQSSITDINSCYFFNLSIKKALVWMSIISLFFGTFSVMMQDNLKRFIAFASIVHVGYIGLGIASSSEFSIQNSAIFYVIIYSFINIGIFSFILLMPNYKISSLSGFAKNNKCLALSFAVLLLSSAGIPPFAGFFTKLYIIKNLIDDNLVVPALLSLIAGVISAFYYLKITKIMYFDEVTEASVLDLKYNNTVVFLMIFTSLVNSLFFLYFIL